MDAATDFYRSQIGGDTVINYCYTDKPWRLLVEDMYYFFVYCWALPWILWPIYPFGSGELDELYPSFQNLFCIFVHLVLLIMQLVFVCLLPATLFLPLWMGLVAVGCFLALNSLICMLLNGSKVEYESEERYAKPKPEHEHEQWVFLNGVATGQHWMQNNLNRLALTFGRPVKGIHNKTSGIIFDVLECLIQRNFSYATNDIRECFKLMKAILYDPGKSKVIFILHSQGGIEGGLVLDWLLQEMPQDLLAKLEVYTFGNAANHFNNPHRHALSELLTRQRPLEAMQTIMTEANFSNAATSPIDIKDWPAQTPTLTKEASTLSNASHTTSVAAMDRAISHVEHYAHSTDFVSIWGVLHFATNGIGSPRIPRFIGRLFDRSTGRGGHQLNQHYLDGMFPLARDPHTGEFTGANEHNPFMDKVVKVKADSKAKGSLNPREAFDITYGGTDGFGSGEITTPVEVHGLKGKALEEGKVTVGELSRLWRYRNGKSPGGKPPFLFEQGGVIRNATM